MRYIIEFGFAYYTSSYLDCDDKFLAAEPLLSAYNRRKQGLEMPEGLVFCQIDELAIAGHDGEIDIKYSPRKIEMADTSDLSDFGEKEETVRVKCLTLDSWLAQYRDEGFTEKIDYLNVCVNGNAADPIFESFSFEPRPEFIMIRQPEFPENSIKQMERHGYRIYLCGGAVTGVKC